MGSQFPRPQRIAFVLTLAATILAATTHTRAQFDARPVGLQGMTLPDGRSLAAVEDQSWGVSGGSIFFLAPTFDGLRTREIIWVERDNTLTANLAYGDPVANTGGDVAAGNSLAIGNALGQTLSATVLQNAVEWAAVQADRQGAVALIIEQADDAPGADAPFWSFNSLQLNDRGRVAVEAYIGQGGTKEGIGLWTNAFTSDLAPAFISGQPAPGGGTFNDTAIYDPALSENALTFTTRVLGVGGTTSGLIAAFIHDSAGTRLLARNGDAAPQTQGGTIQLLSDTPLATDEGGAVFRATTWGGSIAGPVIYVDHNDGQGPQLKYHGASPTAVPGSMISFIDRLAGNAQGDLAFRGTLVTTSPTYSSIDVLWTDARTGQLEVAARVGDVIDGLRIWAIGNESQYAVSDNGLVAFTAKVLDDDTAQDLGEALFLYDRDGRVRLIASEGRALPLTTGETVQLADLTWTGTGTAFRDTLFSGNTIAFHGDLTDGRSGVFAVTVPEPAGLWLCTAALALLRRRR